MDIKHILVHVDDSRHLDVRMRVATDLAAAHEAHVTGLYVIAPPYVPTYMAGHVGAAFYERQRELAEQAAANAGQGFDEKTKASGVSSEWMTASGTVADAVSEIGRYADLVAIGQPDPDEHDAGDPARDAPGSLILQTGRPILVVPYAGKFDRVGRNVLVMWNASREAARAINDAMPLLQRADRVVVTSVNPGHGQPDIGDLPGADISHQLARHGVKAESAPTYAEDIDIGDIVLSRAADMSADLIVMGGYGRSRFREMVLGGATHHLLHHMTVPVLFSH